VNGLAFERELASDSVPVNVPAFVDWNPSVNVTDGPDSMIGWTCGAMSL
jgi:hypothetical protein